MGRMPCGEGPFYSENGGRAWLRSPFWRAGRNRGSVSRDIFSKLSPVAVIACTLPLRLRAGN